jgi:hypothetical protein
MTNNLLHRLTQRIAGSGSWMAPIRYISALLIMLGLSLAAIHAQELSNIGKTDPLAVDGGISVSQVFYDANQSSSYRKPYSYTLNANLNFSVYGWSIPVSAVFSNNSWSYQQPFNQFSLSPSYKWIQTYIGYSSMSFSQYTLNGHQFLGGGVELSPPGNFKISAMAGRLQKRVLPDSSGFAEPAYFRFGSGLKGEYTFNGGSIAVSTFYARDDKSSLGAFRDSTDIRPQENFCYSIAGNMNMIKNVSLAFEFGQSLITEDMYAEILESRSSLVPSFPFRTSTHRYNAYKINANYNSLIGTVGLGYERIDPGYKTLGAYYSTNDFENITFNYAGRVLKDKVTLMFSTGIQRDDLDGTKQQKNKRIVTNVGLGVNPSQKLGLNFNYSNFSSYTNIKSAFDNINTTSPYGNIDTLDFTQLTENYGASANYNPGSNENVRHGLMLSLNFQRAADKQSDNPMHAGAKFYNSMAGYNLGLMKLNLSLGLTMNYNRNTDQGMTNETFGPTLSARKTFFERKVNTSLGVSYNNSLSNGIRQSDVYVIRAGGGYVLQKKHNFDLSAIYALRNNSVKNEKHNELTITLTYRYSFSLKKGRQKETSAQNQGESYSPVQ